MLVDASEYVTLVDVFSPVTRPHRDASSQVQLRQRAFRADAAVVEQHREVPNPAARVFGDVGVTALVIGGPGVVDSLRNVRRFGVAEAVQQGFRIHVPAARGSILDPAAEPELRGVGGGGKAPVARGCPAGGRNRGHERPAGHQLVIAERECADAEPDIDGFLRLFLLGVCPGPGQQTKSEQWDGEASLTMSYLHPDNSCENFSGETMRTGSRFH